MSTSILYRESQSGLLLRDDNDGDGRTVFGIVAPYGQEVTITERGRRYREMFAPQCFAKSIETRGHKIRLMGMHDTERSFPLGRATELREESDGLHAAFHVANTSAGNDALELVRSGLVDSFSVGFRPIKDVERRGVCVRVEAALMEVSLVTRPAYSGAMVAGIRSQQSAPLSADQAQRRLSLLRMENGWTEDRSEDKKPYGDVTYADPGYQKDGKKRYPLDTAEHVKAAWSYINMPKNSSQYTPDQLAKIKAKIRSAAEKFDIELKD